jgi:protein-S-isoprenylcysteine O-methyltransferase Ste14
MDYFDGILRGLTIVSFLLWQIYWWVTEKKADKEKPPTSTKTNLIERYSLFIFYIPLSLQLLGIPLFPLPFIPFLQIAGFLLVLLGMGISVSARISLGTNWSHAASYQIKQKHSLVTSGIYQYIRHPIYTGLLLALTGAELVAQSYLFIAVFLCMFIWSYRAGKREEKILTAHFCKQYTEYKKKSKMLLPFIW